MGKVSSLVFQNCTKIKERIDFSNGKVDELRGALEGRVQCGESVSVVVTGSLGRKEASTQSDIDLFILAESEFSSEDKAKVVAEVDKVLEELEYKKPGDTGTFGSDEWETVETLTKDIGGQHDSNKKLTRRMLLLLEGEWLYGEHLFRKARRELLKTYIKEGTPDHRIARFLLNDVIRYYRTIATDFENKVTECGKSWGLRNIKLRFSRKLLYFSGIITVAETCYKSREEKIKVSERLLDMPPIERIIYLSETDNSDLLKIYSEFIERISDPDVRSLLDSVDKDQRNNVPEFRELKNLGQHFSWKLSSWLRVNYDPGHPIHNSLLF